MNPELTILDNNKFVGEMCFNPSLVKINRKNKDLMIIYRTTPSLADWYTSSIRCVCFDLINHVPKGDNFELISHGEDPRVLPFEGGMMISYTNVDKGYTSAKIEVALIRNGSMALDRRPIDKCILTFDVDGKPQAQKEKNWLFFTLFNHPGTSNHIYIIYTLQPLVLLKCDLNLDEILSIEDRKEEKEIQCYRTTKIREQRWRHPLSDSLRIIGGTPPIYVNGKYFMFAHSKNYRIFVVTMNPALEITGVSQKPILPHRFKGDIMFPCGVVFDEKSGHFHISTGLNDQFMGIIKVSLEFIEGICMNVLNLEEQ